MRPHKTAMVATHPNSYALDTTWRTLLLDLGVRPADILRRAGLPEDLLARPTARLATADYHRLWRSVEATVGDPLLPIRLCEAVRAESFSPPLFAALCSPNLVVAAQRIGRYKTLIAPLRLDVSQAGDLVAVELNWLDAPPAPPPSLVMTELLFCVQLGRIGTREPLRPVTVTTPEPPSPIEPYEAFLGAPVRRGNKAMVTFRAADATRPFLTSNEALWAMFEPDLRRRLADLQAGVTTTERVRAALLEALPSGLISIDAVAVKLGLSKRTLQRRIGSDGNSFQNIVADSRKSLASHYLRNTRMPVAEVSFLLGFEEPNSFYRAFRNWTGTTPERLRSDSVDAEADLALAQACSVAAA